MGPLLKRLGFGPILGAIPWGSGPKMCSQQGPAKGGAFLGPILGPDPNSMDPKSVQTETALIKAHGILLKATLFLTKTCSGRGPVLLADNDVR